VDGQQFVSSFFQTREGLGVFPFQKNPQFPHNLFCRFQPFGFAKTREKPVRRSLGEDGRIATPFSRSRN
jgi:hypothetical protein